jgi:hypothetical protein
MKGSVRVFWPAWLHPGTKVHTSGMLSRTTVSVISAPLKCSISSRAFHNLCQNHSKWSSFALFGGATLRGGDARSPRSPSQGAMARSGRVPEQKLEETDQNRAILFTGLVHSLDVFIEELVGKDRARLEPLGNRRRAGSIANRVRSLGNVAERPLEKQSNPKTQNKSKRREKKGRRSEVHCNVNAKSRGEKTGDPVGGKSVWQLACANSTANTSTLRCPAHCNRWWGSPEQRGYPRRGT